MIAGYRAEIDPAALGFPVAAVVRIRPSPGQLQRIPEIARETAEVGECHRITGEDCYLLRLHLRSIDDLEDVLDRFTPHGLTTTSIIHSTPVPRRGPPLGADEAPSHKCGRVVRVGDAITIGRGEPTALAGQPRMLRYLEQRGPRHPEPAPRPATGATAILELNQLRAR